MTDAVVTTTPTAAMTVEEAKREALRAKFAAKGAYVDGATFKQEDHPVTFAISLEGLEGTGKTKFILSMPGPIVIVNFGDRSAIPFLYKMTVEERARVHLYDIQPSTNDGWTLAEAVESLRTLSEIITVEGPFVRGGTFGIDGGSSWWGVMQQVFVEPKEKEREARGEKKVGGIIYEEANGRFRGIMGYLRTIGCFLAITHQLKQDWNAAGPIPGQYSAKRNNNVPYMVDVVLRLAKFCLICKAPNCQQPDHMGRIHRARLEKLSGNTGLEGLWVGDAEHPFDFALIYSMQTGQPYHAS